MSTRLPVLLLGSLLATAYFGYHAVFGTHGLQANARLSHRMVELDREIAVLQAVQRGLRNDIAALGQEPPPPDTVEELARSVLGFVRPGDRIVLRAGQFARPETRTADGN